jgi:DNA-binding LacI/PurR family transcriptional regulator
MPHFKNESLKHASYSENVLSAIKQIPSNQLVVIDNNKLEVEGDYVEIYQDFENDIYNALKEGLEKIQNYKNLILAYPEKTLYPYPRRILHGFKKFCIEHALEFEIIEEVVEDMILEKGDLFITIEESDLVSIVKQIRESNLDIGKDIGVISYNDTPLKELLGITVVSTDFKVMGETTGEMIMNHKTGKIKNPFRFIDRHSL